MLKNKQKYLILSLFVAFKATASNCYVNDNSNFYTKVPDIDKSGLDIPENHGVRVNYDFAQGKLNNNIDLLGRVIIEQDKLTLNSDKVFLKKVDDNYELLIPSTFLLEDTGGIISASNLNYNFTKKEGFADKFIYKSRFNRGFNVQSVGSKIKMLSTKNFKLYDTKINTCETNDDSWYIKAKEMTIDTDKKVGKAKNASLVLKNIPIFYSPILTFPLSGERKSGFLIPSFNYSSDNGMQIRVPYYINLANNYDLTLTPILYYKRGIGLLSDFRYLKPKYYGTVNLHFIPHDKKVEDIGSRRYALNLNHVYNISNHLQFGIDYNKASDNYFYKDFNNRINTLDETYLNQQAWLSYQNKIYGGYLNAILTFQKYQILQDDYHSIDEPYNIRPQLSVNYNKDFYKLGELNIYSEFARFSHKDKLSGTREVFFPRYTINFQREWGFIKPQFGLHATAYQLDSFNKDGIYIPSRTTTRVVPIFSLDSGLIYERKFKFRNKNYIQTFEPRIFYSYIPTRKQDNLPNFDSSENDFKWDQLFNANRFSGQDRINSNNSVAITFLSNFLDKETGIERLKIGFGQKYYFKQDKVTLDDILSLKRLSKNDKIDNDDYQNYMHNKKNRPDTVFFMRGYINNDLYAFADWHHDRSYNNTDNVSLGFTYNPDIGKLISIRFKNDRNNLLRRNIKYPDKAKIIDISGQWPIKNDFYIIAKQSYSFTDNKPLETIVGIEYKDKCNCWGSNLVLQKYITDYNKYKTAIFFRISFKGLGRIGNNPNDELRKSIPNYVPVSEVKN